MFEPKIFRVYSAPITRDEAAAALLHGSATANSLTSKRPGFSTECNRWFDKSIQLVLFSNGLCGLNAEHGFADAMILIALGMSM